MIDIKRILKNVRIYCCTYIILLFNYYLFIIKELLLINMFIYRCLILKLIKDYNIIQIKIIFIFHSM